MASDSPFLNVHRFGPDQPAQVLAVHGLTGHGLRWRTLATKHLPNASILAPDLLGHGRSSWRAPWTLEANVAALADLLAREATRPVVVVGHSFGGAVALRLAAARPDLVASLVLLDPAVGLDGAWMANIADDMMSSPYYLDRDEARNEKASGSWADVDPAELDAELDEHLVERPDGRYGWRISIPAMMSYWSELARDFVIPHKGIRTTLVRATKTDPPYVTDALITALSEDLGPRFTLVDFDCDHMVAQALPAETAAVIKERLEQA
ncbi:alpha/beta hydrolase [Mycolicibacterium agri]|uniref:Alpha/beta hydrolase n=1 Tax=Mycolicibacterium agri TaxID=36811 RepID=A0A2A7MPA7_MYCAG|nr:alpha/beta hydrolase [Mycolicibacterium agri]PEG33514.1 alpha/beta hydrolase [Mycolicibacterium agri]GFG51639.1 alpha/beta hydrolase [Mycolicibacterium agri]